MGEKKQSVRIQTSILNAAEKKALVWLANRMPSWVNSDMLTAIGSFGALIVCIGYALTNININFLWLASFGFVVNWFGDSLDGTLARVRNRQRPRYGFFLDHNVDCINEVLIFTGLGSSCLMDFRLALFILVAYLLLSICVFINAHLKGEFKLTYAKMGPTEFRLIAIVMNFLLLYVTPLREFRYAVKVFGVDVQATALDCVGVIIFLAITVIYFSGLVKDAREYSREEPYEK